MVCLSGTALYVCKHSWLLVFSKSCMAALVVQFGHVCITDISGWMRHRTQETVMHCDSQVEYLLTPRNLNVGLTAEHSAPTAQRYGANKSAVVQGGVGPEFRQ